MNTNTTFLLKMNLRNLNQLNKKKNIKHKQIKLKMYAEKVDCTNLSNMEINRKRYADKVDYSKQAIEKYREQKNREQGIKYKTQKEKVKGSSSKISLTDLEELYKTTSLLKKELKTKKTTGASKWKL